MHERTLEKVFAQHLVRVEGQTDVLTLGLPYICPYNVNSGMNPILGMLRGAGDLLHRYRGRPAVREGGGVIVPAPPPGDVATQRESVVPDIERHTGARLLDLGSIATE